MIVLSKNIPLVFVVVVIVIDSVVVIVVVDSVVIIVDISDVIVVDMIVCFVVLYFIVRMIIPTTIKIAVVVKHMYQRIFFLLSQNIHLKKLCFSHHLL